MQYTDGEWLAGEDEQELHDFAKRIGLKSGWYKDRHRMYEIWGDPLYYALKEKDLRQTDHATLLTIAKDMKPHLPKLPPLKK